MLDEDDSAEVIDSAREVKVVRVVYMLLQIEVEVQRVQSVAPMPKGSCQDRFEPLLPTTLECSTAYVEYRISSTNLWQRYRHCLHLDQALGTICLWRRLFRNCAHSLCLSRRYKASVNTITISGGLSHRYASTMHQDAVSPSYPQPGPDGDCTRREDGLSARLHDPSATSPQYADRLTCR